MSHTEGVLTRDTLDEGLETLHGMAAPSSSDPAQDVIEQQIQVPWMQAVTVDPYIYYIYNIYIYIYNI